MDTCDCTVVYGREFIEIIYCPMHAAVYAMYEALKSRQRFDSARYWGRHRKSKRFWIRYERLIHGKERAALTLADGDKDSE